MAGRWGRGPAAVGTANTWEEGQYMERANTCEKGQPVRKGPTRGVSVVQPRRQSAHTGQRAANPTRARCARGPRFEVTAGGYATAPCARGGPTVDPRETLRRRRSWRSAAGSPTSQGRCARRGASVARRRYAARRAG
eukprot:5647006-Prymnesium_polylepis.1